MAPRPKKRAGGLRRPAEAERLTGLPFKVKKGIEGLEHIGGRSGKIERVEPGKDYDIQGDAYIATIRGEELAFARDEILLPKSAEYARPASQPETHEEPAEPSENGHRELVGDANGYMIVIYPTANGFQFRFMKAEDGRMRVVEVRGLGQRWDLDEVLNRAHTYADMVGAQIYRLVTKR